jgi:hypothetical protein
MTTQFTDYTFATIQIEEVDGQETERRLEFSLNGLDYSFVFYPLSDSVESGATLTYVGNVEEGRLSPTEYAEEGAWIIANDQLA